MLFRALVCRFLFVAMMSVALTAVVFGGFTSRVWFSNNTTGASGTGAILCKPGDEIWLNFSFHGDATRPNKWSLLQVTFDLATSTIVSDADCNTWYTAIANSFKPSTTYSPVTPWQCSDGNMYDSMIDPSDSTQALITTKGLYMLVGVFGTKAVAQNLDALGFFKFHVSASAVGGDQLVWLYPNRNTQNGLATMVWNNNNYHTLITDNWLVVEVGTTTSTSLAAAPNPCTVGDLVTMAATISPAPDGGTVEFFDGVTDLGPGAVVAGVATLSASFTAAGTHSLTANYGGTHNFAPSSGSTTLQVNPGTPTTTTLTATPNPCHVGDTIALAASVSPIPDGGTVEFRDGGATLGTAPVVGGQAAMPQVFTVAGTHSLQAIFSGTGTYGGSSGTTTLEVQKTATVTTVVASPNPVPVSVSTAITATVSPSPEGEQVYFYDSGGYMGWAYISGGAATVRTTYWGTGTHNLQAVFGGNASYDGSSGSTVLQVRDNTWIENPSNHHLYLLSGGTMDWKYARKQAVMLGGTLAAVNDAVEQTWLLATYGNGEDYFLGLRDVLPGNGKWRWETGEPVAYTNWSPGEPSPEPDQCYVAQRTNGKWDNVQSWFSARAIYERVPPVSQTLQMLSDGTEPTTEPLDAGRQYVVEASGVWAFTRDGQVADADFWMNQQSAWSEDVDSLGLLVNGQYADWQGSADGVSFAPHTFSPSHVYRTLVTGTGDPLAFAIDAGDTGDNFGGLQVRIYTPAPSLGPQADAPWPLVDADRQNTGYLPWAAGPNWTSVQWSRSSVGAPLVVSATGDVYCANGGMLSRVSGPGGLLGQTTLGSQSITGAAIGVDGTVYAVCGNSSVTALTPDLQTLWQQPGGGFCGVTLDDAGNLYYGGWNGDGRVFSRDRSGALRWTLDLGVTLRRGISIGPDGNVYFGASGSSLVYVVSPAGTLLRTLDTGRHGPLPPVFGPTGEMYFMPDDGFIQCFNADGSLRWEYLIDCAYGAPSVLPNGRVTAAGFWDTSLYSFDPDGTLLWEVPEYSHCDEHVRTDAAGTASNVNWSAGLWSVDYLGNTLFSYGFGGLKLPPSHVFGADGTMYVGIDGTLYAVGPGTPVKQEVFVTADNGFVRVGDSTTLSARLALGRNSGGLHGKTLRFLVDGQQVGSAVTDWRGIATAPVTVGSTTSAGAHEVKVIFDGDAATWDVSATGTLWVTHPLATVSGQVFLDLWQVSPAGVPVEFWVLDGQQIVGSTSTALDSSSHYSISLELAGTYSLRAKASHWLSQKQSGVVFDPAHAATQSFSLTNGDAHEDNKIDLLDLSSVLSNFGSTEPVEADLDGSGKVDLRDLAMVLVNWGMVGG